MGCDFERVHKERFYWVLLCIHSVVLCQYLYIKCMEMDLHASEDDEFSTAERGEALRMRELLAQIYPELRRIAKRKLSGERPSHTLQPTALTHEVVLRLLKREIQGEDPQVLVWAGIVEMRRILVDYGRRWQVLNRYKKSWNGTKAAQPEDDAIAMQVLLDEFEKVDARARAVVELRYFLGLSVDETAALLKVSRRTVMNDWDYARGWLSRRLQGKVLVVGNEG